MPCAGYHPHVAVTDDLIHTSPLFRRLAAQDRARVAAVAHLKSYKRGEVIFHEGAAADAFLTIISGRVEVFKTTPSGREIILEIFGAGDPLGAVAVSENARRRHRHSP